MKRKKLSNDSKLKDGVVKGFILDSGAYSAMSKGTSIDIDEYIDFIRKLDGSITWYANLDVIGDAKGTLENQKYMESKGLTPVPVYHYGEDYKYLSQYVSNYKRLAVGGAAGRGLGRQAIRLWLDKLWEDFLTDDDGYPIIGVHAFGITALPLLMRYPWESADSTAWVRIAANGGIAIPKKKKNGDCDYDRSPSILLISDQSPNNGYFGLSEKEKEYVDEYLRSIDVSVSEAIANYKPRIVANTKFFVAVEKYHKLDRFVRREKGFFG